MINEFEQTLQDAAEDEAWLEHDLSDLKSYEPYDWGTSDASDECPVIFDERRGLIVVGGKPKDPRGSIHL